MHTYSLFNILVIFELLWDFSDCLFLSLFFLFTVVVFMAPKRKSALSWNPLRSGALSSSDPTPSHIRFHDEDARKDFSKNFSRQVVYLERWVILANFSDTDLPDVIHSRGWESPCVHVFPMHTYSLFNILVIFELLWDFSDCLSLSPSLFCLR